MATKVQAVNHYVFVKRDVTETESSGLFIPSEGKIKPTTGTVLSVGNLVKDVKIKGSKGGKVLFHKGIGQEINYDGEDYLVLEDIHILAVV